jgi:hypothetical protein
MVMGLWLHKTDPARPWAKLPFHDTNKVRAFFSTVLISEVRNGTNTLFWTDKWLSGQRICDIAHRLFQSIPRRITKELFRRLF